MNDKATLILGLLNRINGTYRYEEMYSAQKEYRDAAWWVCERIKLRSELMQLAREPKCV